MKREWLVYKVAVPFGKAYVTTWSENYPARLKLLGERRIIKENLSLNEASNFCKIMNKLKK